MPCIPARGLSRHPVLKDTLRPHVEPLEARIMLAGDPPTCEDLSGLVLPDTEVYRVDSVAASPSTPAHCHVRGRIEGNIEFFLNLPEHAAWNEKLLINSWGGFYGALPIPGDVGDLLGRGYAIGGTNYGHYSDVGDVDWAWDANTDTFNDKLQTDYGHHALHITNVISRQTIEAYYDDSAEHVYFRGCSMGGRQGVVSAQRYPEDFDGIIAGAPASAWTEIVLTWIAIQQAMFPDPDDLTNPVLPTNKLRILERVILERCDGVDGLKDDVITDPRDCPFVPSEALPRCVPGEDDQQCLTPEQIAVVEAVFAGASNSLGQLSPGYSPAGAESFQGVGGNSCWNGWFIDSSGLSGPEYPNFAFSASSETLRYLAYGDPTVTPHDFDFETDLADLARVAAVIDGTDPNLSGFKAAGGHMIIWQGWADYAVPPEGVISYYEDVVTTMGDREIVEDFLRLFMLPGVVHCGGGFRGPDEVDWLTALEQWVEQDIAPDSTPATGGGYRSQSRPLCPYPQVAVWDGIGDSRTADAFTCQSKPALCMVVGDANFDRQFDTRDIAAVLTAGKYGAGQPATWQEGDWNGDSIFDSGDIVEALQSGQWLVPAKDAVCQPIEFFEWP